MTTATSNATDVQKLGELIKDIKVAMLTTTCQDGTMRSRPMATQENEFDGTLWFFTQAHSSKAAEFGQSGEVNVSYAAPDKQHYVSVSGIAKLVRDADEIKKRWNPILKAWFPKGLDDPELALIRVDPHKAEFWDGPSSTVVHLIGLAKALVTGQAYRPGENKKIDLEK